MADQSLETLLAQGDELYALRREPVQARQALEKYEAALRLNAGAYEACWKACRAQFFLGFTSDEAGEKQKRFAAAIERGKQAVAARPDAVEGHFWLAASYGEYGEARGVLKSLFLVPDIKRELNAALRLDERFMCGATYAALGRLYFKLPGLFGGSSRKAREFLEKAKEICADSTTTLLYLAELYWDRGEKERALQALLRIEQLTPDPAYTAEAEKDKREARRLLQKYSRR